VLKGEIADARRQLELAIEVFTAAGSIFVFDGWCAMISACRAIGDREAQRDASRHAHRLLDADPLRGRFKREVLMVEDAEYSRQQADLTELALSTQSCPTARPWHKNYSAGSVSARYSASAGD